MDNVLQDWKFWAFAINYIVTVGCFCIIKFNDFKHLTKDVEKLDKRVECLDQKVVSVKQDIAVLKEKTKAL